MKNETRAIETMNLFIGKSSFWIFVAPPVPGVALLLKTTSRGFGSKKFLENGYGEEVETAPISLKSVGSQINGCVPIFLGREDRISCN